MLLAEHIAHAAHGVDEPGLPFLLELAAQVSDVYAERVRGRAEVVSPHPLVDHRPGEDLAGVSHEQLEQLELRPGQLDRPGAEASFPHVEIERQSIEAQVAPVTG